MMLDAETQDFLDQLSARGPAQPQATLGEAWRTSWEAAGLTTIGGVRAPRAQALDELATAYRTASGGDPYEEARRRGIPLEAADDEQRAATIAMLSRGLPEGAQQQLAPHLDVNAKAAAIAARTEREAAETAERTWGLSGNAAMVMAGMARAMVDPTTLAVTAGVAALTPETGGLAAFLAREAFINAGATAATQPIVNAQRAGLGLEPAPLLESIAESAVAGAALGGLFRGAGVAARRMFGRGEAGIPAAEGGAPDQFAGGGNMVDMPPAVREAAGHFEPEDFDLAARHLDNRAVEDLQALRPDALGAAEHAQAIDAVAAAIDRGGPMAADALPEATPDREALVAAIDSRARELSPRIFARADELDAQIAQARAEIQRVQERPIPETAFEGRIAEIEADLSQITGKRRSSPRAKELRAELEGLAASRQALIEQQARVNQEQLALLRENLVAMQSERGALGPKVRAVRAHAAGQVSPDRVETGQALRAAAARDAAAPVSRKETAPESVITQNPDFLPPVAKGFVRFFHGGEGADTGGSRWVTPDYEYAQNFRAEGRAKTVWFVDLPKDDPAVIAARNWDEFDEAGKTNMVGRYRHFEVPDIWARRFQRVPTEERPAPGAPARSAPAVRPSRPLSDYPLRQIEPAAPANAKTATAKAETPTAKAKTPPAPPPAATPELAALRASAERAIAEAGEAPFHFTDEATGEARMVAPSALLREIDEDAVAARELEACLAGVIEEAAPQ